MIKIRETTFMDVTVCEATHFHKLGNDKKSCFTFESRFHNNIVLQKNLITLEINLNGNILVFKNTEYDEKFGFCQFLDADYKLEGPVLANTNGVFKDTGLRRKWTVEELWKFVSDFAFKDCSEIN